MTEHASEILNVNLNELKIREIAAIEDMIGGPIDEAFAAGQPKARSLQAIACVVKQRTDPTFTFEQAGEIVISLDAADPTQAA